MTLRRCWIAGLLSSASLLWGDNVDMKFSAAALRAAPGGSVYVDGAIRNGGSGTVYLGNVAVSNGAPAAVTLDSGFAALRGTGLASGAAYDGHLLRLAYPPDAAPGTLPPVHVRVDIGGQTFEIDLTVTISLQANVYRVPQVAAGHLWSTTIVLTNPGASAVDFAIALLGEDGKPLDVPFPALGIRRSLSGTLPPGATQFFNADDGEPLTEGWAEISATDRILASAMYRKTIDGRADWESGVAAVPSGVTRSVLYFDNSGPFTTSLAVANPNAAPADVKLVFRDEHGAPLGEASMTIAPRGQAVARTPSMYPFTDGQRGSIDITAGGAEIAVLGLRFNSVGGVVALPVYQPGGGGA